MRQIQKDHGSSIKVCEKCGGLCESLPLAPATCTRAWVVNHPHQHLTAQLELLLFTPFYACAHVCPHTCPHLFTHTQALNLPRLLAQLGFPVKGHASMPRTMAADATKKMLRHAKVKFHPDKVWAGYGAGEHQVWG